MAKNNWKYIGESQYARIFVDYNNNKTKTIAERYIYIHDGIYPYHNPEYYRRLKR